MVEALLIGGGYARKLEKTLARLGIEMISVPFNKYVSHPLGYHADLSALHLGGNQVFVVNGVMASSSEFVNNLTNRGVRVVESETALRPGYPYEAALNICIVGENVFCNKDIADPLALELLGKSHQIIHIKQGYAKCSICVVDEESVITADPGIIRAAQEHGLQALEISPGDVELSGYNTGFIGGASFKLSACKLAFTGQIVNAESKNRIEQFLSKRNIEPVYLTGEPVFDVGSAIPLTVSSSKYE